MNAKAKAWRCTVCGYVHRGDEPPDECPVCGSPRSAFEPYVEAAAPAAPMTVNRWRCLNCTHVHTGAAAPDVCPVCGARSDRFEAQTGAPAAMPVRELGGAERVLILGGGIAGISAAESLRQAAPEAEITLVTKEAGLPYYRLNLTRFVAGEIGAEGLPIHPTAWYEEQRIHLLSGVEAADLALDEAAAVLHDGRKLAFDKLVLTAGAHPFVPEIPGAHRAGVTTLRTQADAERILAAARAGAACVVIGGGILGLETAGGIARSGGHVTLIESHAWLMPRQLNRQAGDLLANWLARLGIRLRKHATTTELTGDKQVTGVRCREGDVIPAEMVILAAGVRPNSHLARRAGLEVAQGVVIDNHLHTSDPRVLAAGDIAEHRGVLYGNWNAAQYQGAIAGLNAAGARVEFGGLPRSNTLKVLGLDLVSIGAFEPEDGSFQVVEEETDGRYARFVFHDNHLVGAILLGEASRAAIVKQAIESQRDFSGLLERRPALSDVYDYLGPG